MVAADTPAPDGSGKRTYLRERSWSISPYLSCADASTHQEESIRTESVSEYCPGDDAAEIEHRDNNSHNDAVQSIADRRPSERTYPTNL